MRGRKPKPTANQIAAGDPRKLGKKKLQEKLDNEPQAVSGIQDPPERLEGIARDQWLFWRAELEAMGIDKRPDAAMLEGACWNFAGAIDAEKILAREGQTVTESTIADDGDVVILKVKTHPASQIAARRWALVKSFCSEFGLSPVSRTRLSIEKKDSGEEDLAALLSAPREPRKEIVQ